MRSVPGQCSSEIVSHHQAAALGYEGEEGAFDLEPLPSLPFGEPLPCPLPGLYGPSVCPALLAAAGVGAGPSGVAGAGRLVAPAGIGGGI